MVKTSDITLVIYSSLQFFGKGGNNIGKQIPEIILQHILYPMTNIILECIVLSAKMEYYSVSLNSKCLCILNENKYTTLILKLSHGNYAVFVLLVF